MPTKRLSTQRGFSIVELVIVLGMMLVLSAIGLPRIVTSMSCGQKTRRGPSPLKKQIPLSNQCLGVRCLQLAGR